MRPFELVGADGAIALGLEGEPTLTLPARAARNNRLDARRRAAGR
jgi:hypothetical protein